MERSRTDMSYLRAVIHEQPVALTYDQSQHSGNGNTASFFDKTIPQIPRTQISQIHAYVQ